KYAPDEERRCDPRALPQWQQANVLNPLAAGRRQDLDLAFERVLRVGEADVALAAPEESLEYRVEVDLDRLECLEKHRAGGAVDFANCLDQRLAGAHHIVPLGGEELEPLDLFGVLLDCERVDGPDGLECRNDSARLRIQRFEIEIEQRRAIEQLVDRLSPFSLEALDHASAEPRCLGELDLEPVAFLRMCLEPSSPSRQVALSAIEPGIGIGQGRPGGL